MLTPQHDCLRWCQVLSNNELDDMERLIGYTGALPKVEARRLIAAYRELATDYYFQHETILPDGELGLPTTTEERAGLVFKGLVVSALVSTGEIEVATKGKNRRKKNEALDGET